MDKRGQNRSFSLGNFFPENRRTRNPARISLTLLPRNRSGSHVGIMLSFVIFITFLIFLYTIIKPVTDTGTDKRTTLEYLKLVIMENVSANFTSTSIQINESANPNKDCIIVEGLLLPPGLNPPPYIIVKNEEGSMEDIYYDAQGYANLKIDREDRDMTFFRIYNSPEFPLIGDETLNCDSVGIDEYKFGLIKSDTYLFEENLEELILEYDEDYEGLKEGLNIPDEIDFGFNFTKSDGTSESVGEAPQTANVYADDIPIQYIDSNANILPGNLKIKIW